MRNLPPPCDFAIVPDDLDFADEYLEISELQVVLSPIESCVAKPWDLPGGHNKPISVPSISSVPWPYIEDLRNRLSSASTKKK